MVLTQMMESSRESSKGDKFTSTVDPSGEINLKCWEKKTKEMFTNKGRNPRRGFKVKTHGDKPSGQATLSILEWPLQHLPGVSPQCKAPVTEDPRLL